MKNKKFPTIETAADVMSAYCKMDDIKKAKTEGYIMGLMGSSRPIDRNERESA